MKASSDRVTRRIFLKTGGAVAAATGLAGCTTPYYRANSSAKPIPSQGKVVVVGAGFAGIGASERLLEAGYQVELLEARDRIGGRVATKSLGGFPADLGATWLRPYNNQLLGFAQDQGLIGAPTDFADVSALGNGQKQKIDVGEAQARFEGSLALPYLKFKTQEFLGGDPRSPSLEAIFDGQLEQAGVEGCLFRRMLESAAANELKAVSGAVFFESGGTSELLAEPTVVGGMSALLDALAQRSQPQFGEMVQVISRTADGVRVRTDKRVIDADAVIVTAPVSVLQKGLITFEPELPEGHRRALSHLEMGTFAKLWIRYPAGSWESGSALVVDCDSSRIDLVFDFQQTHGLPILLGGAAGPRGAVMESLSDAEAMQILHEDLQRMFGKKLPPPTDFVMNRWGRDPLAGGCYAAYTPEFRPSDAACLREPIAERILLAGDAYPEQNSGYVDGAWGDGRRAAGLLISV